MQLINCLAGDAILAGHYFRAALEPSVIGRLSSLLGDDRARALLPAELYDALRAGAIEYVTPVNDAAAESIPDNDRVYVFDLRAFATPETVGQLAARLDGLAMATRLRSLERIRQNDAYGPGGLAARAVAKQVETEKQKEESLTHRAAELLKQLGWVVLVILALMLLLIAHKAYREVTT